MKHFFSLRRGAHSVAFFNVSLVLFVISLAFAGCQQTEEERPLPTVTSFTPTHGVPGSSVTITGTDFMNGSLTLNKVKVNGVDAEITEATSTHLTFIVPQTTSGVISVDVYGKVVTTTDSYEVLNDIPRDGLVAFYPFSGNASDASENGLNGTVNGATLSTDRFSNADHAYNFDGTDDYISLGNPQQLQISTSITIAGWVNITAFKGSHNPGTDATAIVKKIYNDPDMGGNPTQGYEILLDYYGGGDPSFITHIYSYTGSTLNQFTSMYVGEHPLSTSNWIFFTMIVDAKALKFYQNGTAVNDVTQSKNIITDGSQADLTIGGTANYYYFNGKIDDIAIYNRALSADEVTQLYTQTITKY